MTTENQNSGQSQSQDNNPGCSVDWGWLEGRKIARATNDLQNIIIEFEDGLTFKIQALTYKGQAFLSFTPYKDPKGGMK
jgi:hypothetical protein